jgi:hypothetical protein
MHGAKAAATHKLEVAIADLRAAGAADFTFLDGHRGGAASWSAQLPWLKQAADWVAECEMAGVRTVSNKADPMRDAFVRQLMMIWKGYGGRISHGDGPLVRFLSAVTAPALIWAGEKPMTIDAVKGSVRRIHKMAS